ncbi:MAG: magnesium transporter [Halioglobus sp.]|jgi:magnesium transporter
MIRGMLLQSDGHCMEGGEELIAQWQTMPEARLWLDIDGVITEEIFSLLESMDCDPLSIKDSSRVRHPPKIEHFEHNTFLLFRGISQLGKNLELVPQQIGLWVAARLLISVHRGHSVSVEHLWEQSSHKPLLAEPGRLVLRLIHYASGRYLDTMLEFEERLSDLEDGLLADISEADMKELVAYRSRLRKLRRVFNYHQVLTDSIWRHGGPYLGEGDDELRHIRRDVYDRCERLYSLCTMYYELCSDLVEGHISLSSHNLNGTMKILTIISAIFVPMTFMAGIYGMNFEHMPELGWRYAYFGLLGLMAAMAISMLVIFKKIKWL